MRTVAVVIIPTVVVVIIGGILAVAARPESSSDQAPIQQTVPLPTQVASSGVESNDSNNPGQIQPVIAGVDRPFATPVLDIGYDDSWLANVPEFIGEFRVIRIDTPRSKACSISPIITLLAPQKSMDEYLGNVPDTRSLLKSIPGLPADVTLSVVGSPVDKEEVAANLAKWNENRSKDGCISLGPRPRLSDP